MKKLISLFLILVSMLWCFVPMSNASVDSQPGRFVLTSKRPSSRPGAPVTHPEETLTFTFDDNGYAVFEITPLSRPSYYVEFINADDEIEAEGFITLTVPGIYVGELTGEYTVVCLYTGGQLEGTFIF